MKYNLAIAAVFKDEDRYLDEWITYHTLLGVDHFYLLNNSTNPEISNEILNKYKNITVQNWDQKLPHWSGNNYILKNYGNLCNWLAFIDIDEFIFPLNSDNIPSLLSRYEKPNTGSLSIHWVIFGSSGLLVEPDLVTQSFLYRNPNKDRANRIVKCIVRPKYTTQFNVHFCDYITDYYSINELGKKLAKGKKLYNGKIIESNKPPKEEISNSIIRINHYSNKSKQHQQAKIDKGFADINSYKNWDWYFNYMERNEVFDNSMSRFAWMFKNV